MFVRNRRVCHYSCVQSDNGRYHMLKYTVPIGSTENLTGSTKICPAQYKAELLWIISGVPASNMSVFTCQDMDDDQLLRALH